MARLKAAGVEIHAAAHITGGGLPENLPRVFPDGLAPTINEGSWPVNAAIRAIIDSGRVPEDDLWSTFNMGLGLCLALRSEDAAQAVSLIAGAHVVGEVHPGPPGLRRTGAGSPPFR
jgi:phosphoribosylformylglycinamidine cyclo-ligase